MRSLILGAICAVVAGCSDTSGDIPQAPAERVAIAPQQFALVPCQPLKGDVLPPCQLLAAGGKYYLLGAPEGALYSLREEEVRLLDGVLLFSLLPGHVDGLDTIRNTTWLKGRAEPLLVAGPEGTEALTSGLDTAFEISDAEAFSIDAPSGGFDASLLQPMEILFGTDAGSEVVNTGDLIVRGFYAPSGQAVYQVLYADQIAGVGMCGGEEDAAFLQEIAGDGVVSMCNENSDVIYILQ